MTVPAEDPRSGETTIPRFVIVGEWLAEETDEHTCGTGRDGHYGAHEPGCGLVPILPLRELDERLRAAAPPAAGRGDTDSSGEGLADVAAAFADRDDMPDRPVFPPARPTARPAVDRAQPPEGLREAMAVWLYGKVTHRDKIVQTMWPELPASIQVGWMDWADELLALPEVAALLDAQAAVGRVEALAEEYRIFGMVLHDVKQAELFADVAKELRRALGGPS